MTHEKPAGPKAPRDYDLDFRLSRRAFFPALLREVRALTGSLDGTPNYPLSELPNLPDECLSGLIPRIVAPWAIDVEGEWLRARNQETGVSIDLVPSTEGNTAAVKSFDGRTSLGAVGRSLAAHMGWAGEEGFALARDLFLTLVGRRICIPRNPPESRE